MAIQQIFHSYIRIIRYSLCSRSCVKCRGSYCETDIRILAPSRCKASDLLVTTTSTSHSDRADTLGTGWDSPGLMPAVAQSLLAARFCVLRLGYWSFVLILMPGFQRLGHSLTELCQWMPILPRSRWNVGLWTTNCVPSPRTAKSHRLGRTEGWRVSFLPHTHPRCIYATNFVTLF